LDNTGKDGGRLKHPSKSLFTKGETFKGGSKMKRKIIAGILLVFTLSAIGWVVLAEEAKSKSSEQERVWENYEITDTSLHRLKEKELPEDLLEKLTALRKQKYTGEEAFLSALKKAIGKEPTAQYKLQILRAAWYYAKGNRREPFEELVKPTLPPDPSDTPTPANGACDSPLGEFEVGEFRVIGILLGEPGDLARVLAPDGKSYTIVVGTCIGKFNGKVVSFSDNCVTVKEMKPVQEGDKTTVKESETQLCINPQEEEKAP
jgi:Tfp pilus assembly protein PilP